MARTELVQEERLAAEQAPAAHEEDLDARLGALARQPQDVLVLRLDRDDLLALADRVQRLDLVAEDARPLELLLGGGLLHLGGQPPGQVLVPALEEGLRRPSPSGRTPRASPSRCTGRCTGGCSTGGTAAPPPRRS